MSSPHPPASSEEGEEFVTIGCCKVPRPPSSVNSDDIVTPDKFKNDLDVFVSALSSPPPGRSVIADHGLISIVVAAVEYGRTLKVMLQSSENARCEAMSKLRAKTKLAGGNAVLNVKIDMEQQGAVSILYAHGNAVQLDKEAPTSWASTIYDTPPYFAWKTPEPPSQPPGVEMKF